MAEIIIVDESDNEIAHKKKDKLKKNDIYRASALWIKDSFGKILLAKRSLSKEHGPGEWGPAVAGTVEKGESYKQNIIKETEEEIGLKDIKPVKGPKLRIRGKYHYFLQWFFFSIDKRAENFVIDKEEVAEVRWFSKEELLESIKAEPDKFLSRLDTYVEAFS